MTQLRENVPAKYATPVAGVQMGVAVKEPRTGELQGGGGQCQTCLRPRKRATASGEKGNRETEDRSGGGEFACGVIETFFLIKLWAREKWV